MDRPDGFVTALYTQSWQLDTFSGLLCIDAWPLAHAALPFSYTHKSLETVVLSCPLLSAPLSVVSTSTIFHSCQ